MTEEIFKITPDRERAESLLEMCKERLELIKILPKNRPYKIIEDYYEIIKELLTAIMYIDGFKTLSHVKLIEHFSINYDVIEGHTLKIIDILRKHRHGIVYYGKKISKDFLINSEPTIKNVINVLIKLVENKLK